MAREGSLSGAARALGVEHSTVARRIDALEDALGARVFLRNPRGYTLTRVGQALRESTEAMHARVDEVVRLAAGQDVAMTGAVRVATADTLAKHIVVPALVPLCRDHAGLSLEVTSDTRQHDLSRREADVALRIGASADSRLVGRRLGLLGFGLYGAQPRPQRMSLARAKFVMFDDTVGKLPHDAWLADNAAGARVVFRSNRQETLIEAVRLGLGLGLLPCLVAERASGLTRWLGPDEVFRRELWLLVHADLQGSRRVRAVMAAITNWIVANADSVAGG